MVYTIGGKKEYGGPLSEGKRIRKAGLVENLGYRVLEILNGDKQDFSGVTHGGSVWPTFEAAQSFLDTAPNDGTPPDVNPTTHAVYAVDADWDDDTYQVNGVEKTVFKSKPDLYEDQTGKKPAEGVMLQITCSCGCANYGIYFDYEFARYVVICSKCFKRRSIMTNEIPDSPEVFDSED